MQYRERRRVLAMARAFRAAQADKDNYEEFVGREEFLAGLR